MRSSQYRKFPRHYNANDVFTLELSQQQAQYITNHLAKGYSTVASIKSQLKSLNKKVGDQNILNSNVPAHQHSHNLKNVSLHKQIVPKNTLTKVGAKKPTKQQIPIIMRPCVKILQQLKANKNAWPFETPVDAKGLGITDYYKIIKQPMDLQTVQHKLKYLKYSTPQNFYEDIYKIIKNSYLFNKQNEEFVKLTSQFEKFFNKIAPQTKPVVQVDKQSTRQKQLQKQRQIERQKRQLQLKNETFQKAHQKKKKKGLPKDLLQAQNISIDQKLQLATNLHNLPKQHIKGIKQIVFQISRLVEQPIVCEQFDIQRIGYKKIRQLQKYIRSHKLTDVEIKQTNHQKKDQIDLDQMESQWTEQFIE